MLAPPLARFALVFGPPEYSALLFLALIIVAYIGSGEKTIGLWVQLLRVPYRVLFPLILIFCLIGVYAMNASRFEMFLVIIFGVFGYIMRKLDYEMAPLIIGLMIGPMLETAVRQSLLLSKGSFAIFVTRPISTCFLAIALIIIGRSFLSIWKKRGSLAERKFSHP